MDWHKLKATGSNMDMELKDWEFLNDLGVPYFLREQWIDGLAKAARNLAEEIDRQAYEMAKADLAAAEQLFKVPQQWTPYKPGKLKFAFYPEGNKR